jgi:tetratricopeptide (TPR) repeat protein
VLINKYSFYSIIMFRKYLIALVLTLTFYVNLESQSIYEKIAIASCPCLELIESYGELQDSLNSCIAGGIEQLYDSFTEEEQKRLSTVNGMNEIYAKEGEIISHYCYNVRRLIVEEKTRYYDNLSADSIANSYYYQGAEYLENGDYENSIKASKSAVAIDKNLAYAYDNIGICYRRLDEYKNAVKYYKKSLEIFPEGQVALLNIAVAYTYLEDYDEALINYEFLKYMYKDYPEGYFGAGKILYLQSDYEKALENLFTAHRIYAETGSEYIKDSEQIIGLIYTDLKKQDRLDVFNKVAQEYNISVTE